MIPFLSSGKHMIVQSYQPIFVYINQTRAGINLSTGDGLWFQRISFWMLTKIQSRKLTFGVRVFWAVTNNTQTVGKLTTNPLEYPLVETC